MKTKPLIYDPRIKQNILLTENPNPALILLDLILRTPCSFRASTLEEIMERCGKLADLCDEGISSKLAILERIKAEDDGK